MAINTSRVKKWVAIALKVALALGLLTYLVRSGHLDPKELWAVMTPANVALGLALVGLSTYLSAWRWILLLRARGIAISQSYGVSLYLIGIFFNHALPGSVGGDVVRGYYLVADYPGHRLDAILSVLIDRVLGLYSFFILALVAVIIDWRFVTEQESLRLLALFCAVMFVGMTGFFVTVFSPRLTRALGLDFLERRVPPLHCLVEGFQAYGRNRGTIINSVAISVLAQLIVMLFFKEIGVVTGEEVSWTSILFAVPMGFLVTAIPISPAGVGVGQMAFLYLFKVYLARETSYGAVAVTAFQLTLLSWGLVGALLYLRRQRPAVEGGAPA